MPAANATLVETELAPQADEARGLIRQPERPRLPIQVPVMADLGGTSVGAEVLGSTSSVLLVQGHDSGASLPALGSPIRLRLEWDRQVLHGRLAAHGVGGRFLVALGERPIRRSRRLTVDLQAVAVTRSGQLGSNAVDVRITDLSTGGARVEGMQLPVGSEVELYFTPPGRSAPITVLGFVVRTIDGPDLPRVGVAFRLVQASMDVLASATAPTTLPS
jgi:hypothetical protein